MSETRCRHRLPTPETAGYTTLEELRQVARQYPHLRPCPRHKGEKGSWGWTYRKYCESCPEAMRKA